MTPQVRAWSQKLQHFTFDIRYPYNTPSLRNVLGHVIAFQSNNDGAISEIRDGDTPSVIAALIGARIERNLVPYAEEVRGLAARYRQAKDLENYRNMMPEVLALDELATASGRPILPEELNAFFKKEAANFKLALQHGNHLVKWIYGPPANLLEEIDWQQPVQHMVARLHSLSQQAADEFGEELGIVLYEEKDNGIILTSKGSRYAEKIPTAIYSDEEKPRYNGFMKTGEWYKPWAIPFLSGAIENKLTIQSIDLLPRALKLVERDPWDGPRSWNPVGGDNGSDLVVVRSSLLRPSVKKMILKAAAVVAGAASIGFPALFAYTPALAPWVGWAILASLIIASGLGLMVRRN